VGGIEALAVQERIDDARNVAFPMIDGKIAR